MALFLFICTYFIYYIIIFIRDVPLSPACFHANKIIYTFGAAVLRNWVAIVVSDWHRTDPDSSFLLLILSGPLQA